MLKRNQTDRKQRGAVTNKDLVSFTRHLTLMLESGLDLRSALQVSGDVTSKAKLDKAVRSVGRDVQIGIPLSEAIARQRLFDRFVIEMLRAGEATGDVLSVLRRVNVYLEKRIKIQQTVQKATVYPVVTLVFSLVAVIAMLALVVPQFVSIVEGLGAELPPLTQAVVAVSEFVQQNVLVLIGLVALAIGGITLGRRIPWVRTATDRVLLGLPVVGPVVRANALTQWTGSLAFCLHAGLDIRSSLDVSRRLVGLAPFDRALRDVRQHVSDGDSLAAAVARHPDMFPNLIQGVVRVGEQSGSLEAPLQSAASFYEDELDTLSASVGSAIEPFLMVFIGGIVGVVVVSMMLPMAAALQEAGGF